jgi:pectate lyase
MSVAILLVLAASVFILIILVERALAPTEAVDTLAGQTGTTAVLADATTTTAGGSGASTTTDIASAQAPTLIRPISAVASSTLKATATNSYGATNLLDGDVTTAWNEGAQGVGIGEWVRFSFSKEIVISRIEIANGYQKDQQRFQGNPRVKSVKIEYSNGATQLVDLLDTMEFQALTPTHQPVEWVKLVIVSVYPGDQWEDTALSEVRFYASQ